MRHVRFLLCATLAAVTIGVACAPARPAPMTLPPVDLSPAPPRHLQIDVAVRDAPYAFYFIGIEKGFYADEGLDVEVISSGGSTSVAALLSGDLPFTTASSASLSAILKGGPLK